MSNIDGTQQVLPPLQSAFGPASASAPLPQMQPGAAPGGAPPTPGAMDPSFAGAIMALIKSLAQNFAPKGVVDAKARTNQSIDQASE